MFISIFYIFDNYKMVQLHFNFQVISYSCCSYAPIFLIKTNPNYNALSFMYALISLTLFLGVYQICSLCLVSSAAFLSALTLGLHCKGTDGIPPPPWLRKCVLGCLAPVLFVHPCPPRKGALRFQVKITLRPKNFKKLFFTLIYYTYILILFYRSSISSTYYLYVPLLSFNQQLLSRVRVTAKQGKATIFVLLQIEKRN